MRVDAAKVSTYYIVLVHWQAVTAFAGGDWPLENTKEAAWQEFSRLWNATGMTFGSAFNCPLCASVMDPYGDHALVCPCNGDRTASTNSKNNGRNLVGTGLSGSASRMDATFLMNIKFHSRF